MSAFLIPRPSYQPDRLPRGLAHRVEAAHGDGLVGVARVQAAAFVTHTALSCTAGLTAEESLLITQAPLGEARYRAIVDQFTGVACAEIAGLAWR